ncbi:glycerate kinase [Corynebacterium choanae]|uniref:Glycerate kinase family protein n=1 Tax=Corynebacterium choanae TaxID=1862358 RepID=A0A3G6J815_9CORY|nr:glycerate kinase [Corynebacterium choanae]AZA13913.1 Glycerate kinase family protein [Corynebacterium choanae]
MSAHEVSSDFSNPAAAANLPMTISWHSTAAQHPETAETPAHSAQQHNPSQSVLLHLDWNTPLTPNPALYSTVHCPTVNALGELIDGHYFLSRGGSGMRTSAIIPATELLHRHTVLDQQGNTGTHSFTPSDTAANVAAIGELVARGDSYGVGVLLADAITRGAQRIIVDARGLAVVDAGAGIAVAFAAPLVNADHQVVPAGLRGLSQATAFDLSQVHAAIVQPEIVTVETPDTPVGPIAEVCDDAVFHRLTDSLMPAGIDTAQRAAILAMRDTVRGSRLGLVPALLTTELAGLNRVAVASPLLLAVLATAGDAPSTSVTVTTSPSTTAAADKTDTTTPHPVDPAALRWPFPQIH